VSERWLVTGGAGFCGRAIVDLLVERGERVRVLDLVAPERSDVEAVLGDVRDATLVRRAVSGCDRVIHAAAAVPLSRSGPGFYATNVGGTAHVLAASAGRAAKVVVVSSSAVYGASALPPIDASTPDAPRDPYGKSKAVADALAWAWADSGADVAVVRPRTVVGPGRAGLFSILFEWVRRGQPIPLLGDGSARYQFVHVDDLAAACVAAARAPGRGPWLIGSPQPRTWREILEGLVACAGTGSRIVAVPDRALRWVVATAALLPGGVVAPYHAVAYGRAIWFDTAATEAALGWRALRDDADAFADAWRWYAAHHRDKPGPTAHLRPLAEGWLRWAARAAAAFG